MRNVLLYFSLKYHGDWEKIYSALDKKEKIPEEKLEMVAREKHNFITIIDEDYPRRLKRITQPPFVLFYKGNLNILKKINKSIAIIGSRKASSDAASNTENIVKDLKDITIVSGMAKGIDGFGHKSALANGNPTIAVLGSGINYIYPEENKNLYDAIVKKGIVISEYPDQTKPSKISFKTRNRLISGLADGVLVIESKKNSGTMNTVSHALSQNKEVMCLPSSDLGNSGTNALIKEGATLVESGKEIIKELF